jgi:membrane-associated protein
MRRSVFTAFNIVGAAIWATAVILIGFGLGHIPGVADFVSRYLDLILVAIVVLSVGPVLIRAVVIRMRRRREEGAKEDARNSG